MRLHRFIGDFDLKNTSFEIEDKDLIQQWQSVLRFEVGDELILCDGKGREAKAKILDISKKKAKGEILESQEKILPTGRKVTLCIAMLRRENFDLVLQKATELGVTHIVPLRTHRTVKDDINRDRMQRILKEASEQSGRTILPVLEEIQTLEERLSKAKDFDKNIFLDFSEHSLQNESFDTTETVQICVGPEGGWTEEERILAEKFKWKILNLGELVLRAETAAITSCFVVKNNI